jgi:hypothetical protein
MSFISCALSLFALKNSKLSSAKSKWLTIGADGATFIPLRLDDSTLDFNSHKRPSAANKNK